MTQPGKLRAYGQNCPTVEVFPGPLIVTGSPSWDCGCLAMGQMVIQRESDDNIQVYVYCGKDHSQKPILVPLGQHIPNHSNGGISSDGNVKAAVSPVSSSGIKAVIEVTPTEHETSGDNSKKDRDDESKEEKKINEKIFK